MERNEIEALVKSKSVGVGILLTLFFGPLGLLYASITGGIIMCIIGFLLIILSFVPFIGFVTVPLIFIVYFICVIWCIVSVKSYNDRLLARIKSEA
jgi:hypothetical protein